MITGERVVSAAGGFNPTWQRHVAAYALCAPLLGDGRVLDLGCGVGHSFHLLAPRASVGVDIDAQALAGQARETVVADMRSLPFADKSFASVLSVQSIEHVPDAERVVAEAARVVQADGTVVFVTPNRLTFGRPDEIIDPYHWVEYDAARLRALAQTGFADVEIRAIAGSARYLALLDAERARLDRALALDPLKLRRRLSRPALQWLYDAALTVARRRENGQTAAIGVEDFTLTGDDIARSLDLVAICRHPR